MNKRTRWTFALLLLGFAASSAAEAQSLFATRGLGMPVAAVDARGRALGGVGIGIAGLSTSLINPADVAGISRSGVTAALQPTSGSIDVDGEQGDLGGARFPLARVLFPLSSRLVATIGYGGVLEQSFGVRSEGVEVIGGDTVAVTDEVESNGGLAEVGLGFAWLARPNLALGVSAGLYAGNQRRTAVRMFADTLSDFDPFREEFVWDYRAPFLRLGVRWDPAALVRLGASVTFADVLDVEGGNDRSPNAIAPLPLRVAFGASGFLSPELLLSVGAERVLQGGDGNVFEGDAASAIARDTWRVGGGVEFGGLGSGASTWPLRLGASWAQFPYHGVDESPVTEWNAAAGIGFRLAGDPSDPLAVLDATIERGGRKGLESTRNPSGLQERYWRMTISLSLFGR